VGFNEISGNERVKKILRLALEKGRVPNSLLFSGPKGVGKRSMARILAQAINCEREVSDACGKCSTCVAIARLRLPDVWEVEPAGQVIKIEQMREVRQMAYLKPMVARKRVVIVDDADKMTDDASNSLLKILEEPPLFSHIILVTAQAHLILPTIKSRCQVLNFSPIGKEEIKRVLMERNYPEDKARIMALLVNGNLEEAMELEWEGVQEKRKEAWNFLLSLLHQGEAAAFFRSYAFAQRNLVRKDFETVLGMLASFCRDLTLLKAGGEPRLLLNPDHADDLESLKTGWTPERFLECFDEIERTIFGLDKNLNMSLLVTSLYSLVGD
jgi:DNA polymerase-3 subunit delta'